MKRGKNKGEGKAKNVNKPLKWRARYEPAAKRKTGYDKVLYPVQDIVDQTPPSKKLESEVNWKAAFDPSKSIDQRPKADVHCINEARKAKGQPTITTPDAIMQQRKIDYIVNSEAKFYESLAARAEKSRVNCELRYYSKAEHRKSTALKYKGKKFPAKAKFVGPPKPNAITEHNIGKVSSTLASGNAYAFARKKPVVTTGLAPSGRPISDFLDGGKWPPKKQKLHSVTHHPYSIPSKNELVIASRNNPAFAPDVPMLKWYINNYAPDEWPDIIKDYVYYLDGEWKPDKKKLASTQATNDYYNVGALERDHQRAVSDFYEYKEAAIEQHEQDTRTIDELREYITQLESEFSPVSAVNGSRREYHLDRQVKDLKAQLESVQEENFLMQKELDFAHWEIAISRDGEDASQVESPLPVSELATLFNVFKSQWNDDPLNAFCRIYNVPKGKRQALKYKFDRECDLRVLLSDERSYYRRLSRRAKVYEAPRKAVRLRQEIQSLRRLGNHAGYAAWLQNHAPSSEYVTLCNQRNVIQTLRYERGVHSKWATTNRTLGCNKSINNRIELEKAQEIERIKSIMDTKTYKVLKATKTILTAELNPWARKQQAADAKRKAALKKKSLKAKAVKASKIKELQDKKLNESDERQKIRDAMRIAH